MHYKSPYPPLPPVPDCNVHDFLFSSPALTDPQDKLILIDPLNGKNWHKNEFKERVFDCATALVTAESEGGLGFSPEGEMIGIMSTNCLVSTSDFPLGSKLHPDRTQGIHHPRPFAVQGRDPLLTDSLRCNRVRARPLVPHVGGHALVRPP